MSEQLKEWIASWTRPEGLVVIAALVIWMVQLNIGFTTIKEDIGQLKRADAEIVETLQDVQANAVKTATLLSFIQSRVATMEELRDQVVRNEATLDAIATQEALHGRNQ